MKNNSHRNSLLVLATVAILAVVVFTLYLLPSDSFSQTKVYFEPMGNFSFQVPGSFDIQREKINEGEVILKLVAQNDISSANPGLANIVAYKQVEDRTLEDQAAAFLAINKNELIPYQFKSDAYSYLSQNGQELSYYYFVENDGYVIVFKFNKSYFDKSNPLILIDNSLYANTILKTLNSIKFEELT